MNAPTRFSVWWALGAMVGLGAMPAAEPARAGFESFPFTQAGKEVTVRYFLPARATPHSPVVIVMHGMRRNGEDYLNSWMPLAETAGFLVVVPEFSEKEFPGGRGYILGNVQDESGRLRPRSEWAFGMIDPIFDAVVARTGNKSPRYLLYGHSAGAQFVHRMLYLVPDARIERAVAANAGWYTRPTLEVDFPYGLRGLPVTAADLRQALQRPLTVLLGTADTDPQHPSLRHSPEAEAQGPHRLARGHSFFAFARREAQSLDGAFGWSLVFVPGVAHSDPGMAPFAVEALLLSPLQAKTETYPH